MFPVPEFFNTYVHRAYNSSHDSGSPKAFLWRLPRYSLTPILISRCLLHLGQAFANEEDADTCQRSFGTIAFAGTRECGSGGPEAYPGASVDMERCTEIDSLDVEYGLKRLGTDSEAA